VAVLAVGLGPVPVPPGTVVQVLVHHLVGPVWGTPDWSINDDNIVWQIRAPRVLLGAVVGAGLAVSGVAVQAMVRNALADPYLLGVTSGASTGAAAAILFGVGTGLGAVSLSGTAFLGAVAATALVFLVARIGGRLTPTRLVLAGVAVGYGLSAVTSFLVVAANTRDGARAVMFWLLGSLDQTRWSMLPLPLAAGVLTLAVLLLRARALDALAIGDETALALGTAPGPTRTRLFALVALCVGTIVAVSGAVGFVGLVVPHLARRLVGGEHRAVLPVAALAGALLVVAADLLARVAFQPREVPLGIVTALIGVPWLVALLRRFHGTV
jgi:iron complex transport system permease protein